MILTVVEIPDLCGPRCSIYSVLEEGEKYTLFEKFLDENEDTYLDEVNKIYSRLDAIAFNTGVRDHYLNCEKGNSNERHLEENVCDIRVNPDRILRLYCIKMSREVLIVGGGGPKHVKAIQDDKKLTKENYILRHISREMYKRILPPHKDVSYSEDGLKLTGDLTFYYEQ